MTCLLTYMTPIGSKTLHGVLLKKGEESWKQSQRSKVKSLYQFTKFQHIGVFFFMAIFPRLLLIAFSF